MNRRTHEGRALRAALALLRSFAVPVLVGCALLLVGARVAHSYDPAVFDNHRSSYESQCDGGAYRNDMHQPCLWAWLESNA